MTKKIMLSAVQPSNQLTLGNYLGAIKGWVEMQADYDCLFFVVDLHAITVRQDPKKLQEQTYTAVATYLAAGIDPSRALLFAQSHVSEHAELGWVLTCFSTIGELGRMTQYKDRVSKLDANEGVGAGLFTYPVLMAADILLYGTHVVPVGDDQRQHLQLVRDLAIRVNQYVQAPLFEVPEPITPKIGARIMSLRDPSRKMSKSDADPKASVFLSDSNDEIVKKIRAAVTDSGLEVTPSVEKPGVLNLLHINAAVTGRSIEAVVAGFAGRSYGHLKVETADAVVAKVGPIRDRIQKLLDDKQYLREVLNEGAESARNRALYTLKRAYQLLGFIPRREPPSFI